MKILRLLGLVLVAAFAVGAVAASAATAVEFLLAEWLAAGVPVTTATALDGEGEVEFEDLNVFGNAVKTLCSFILDGTVSANGEDEFTKLLSLAGVDAGEPLVGPGVTCTNTANCGGTPKFWAEDLPWKTLLELMIDGGETFFVDLLLLFAFYTECTVLGVKVEDLCSGAENANQQTNEAGGVVDLIFSDSFQALAGLKLGACSLGGAESLASTGLITLLLTSGTALTVSSE